MVFTCNDVTYWSGDFTGDNVIRNGEFCGVKKPFVICPNQEQYSGLFVNITVYPTDYDAVQLNEVLRDTTKVIYESEFINHILPIANQYTVTNQAAETIVPSFGGVGPGFYTCLEARTQAGNYYTTKNISEYNFKIFAIICSSAPTQIKFYSLQQDFKSIAGEDLFGTYVDYLGVFTINCNFSGPPSFIAAGFMKSCPCTAFACLSNVYNTHICFRSNPYVM